MSYRNPQQIVDTQSGQHIQNMLKQVTGAATGTIKTIQAKYRQREKENIAEQQQIIKGVAKVANSANAEDILNSGTDWAPAIREGVARYQVLYTKSIKDKVIKEGYDEKLGARPLKRAVQKYVIDEVADFILDYESDEVISKISIGWDSKEEKVDITIKK